MYKLKRKIKENYQEQNKIKKFLENTRLLLITILIMILSFNAIGILYINSLKEENILMESKTNSSDLISIYLENENGEYIYSRDNKFPTEGYKYNHERSHCVNESVLSWDDVNFQISVSAKGSDKCHIYFDEIPSTAVLHIIEKQNEEDGLYQHTTDLEYSAEDNNYRYSGLDPNNYITFNDESWRIVGIYEMDGEYQLKIVKTVRLGSFAFDVDAGEHESFNAKSLKTEGGYNTEFLQLVSASGSNEWETSDLMYYLNTTYYQSLNSENMSQISGNQYYIGSINYSLNYTTSKDIYDTVVTKKTTNYYYIGILDASDVVYGKDTSLWPLKDTSYFDSVNSRNQWYSDNWVISEELDTVCTSMTITPYIYYSDMSMLTSYSLINTCYDGFSGTMSASVYPSLFLKPEVIISSGTGTESDPFILAV